MNIIEGVLDTSGASQPKYLLGSNRIKVEYSFALYIPRFVCDETAEYAVNSMIEPPNHSFTEEGTQP